MHSAQKFVTLAKLAAQLCFSLPWWFFQFVVIVIGVVVVQWAMAKTEMRQFAVACKFSLPLVGMVPYFAHAKLKCSLIKLDVCSLQQQIAPTRRESILQH